MSMFVKLTTVATVVVFGILAAGFYYFNITDNVEMGFEEGGVMQYDETMVTQQADTEAKEILSSPEAAVVSEEKPVADASEVMYKLFSLNTANSFEVKLPEGNQSVALTHFINIKQTELAVGDYEEGDVRGRVLLDYMRITPLNFDSVLNLDAETHVAIDDDPTMQIMPFVAPFILTNQGSGVFWYIGLFNLDYGDKTLKHLGSVMLGDRIEIDSIEPVYPFESPYKIAVTYRDRTPSQAMSEEPKVIKTIEMTVSQSEIK